LIKVVQFQRIIKVLLISGRQLTIYSLVCSCHYMHACSFVPNYYFLPPFFFFQVYLYESAKNSGKYLSSSYTDFVWLIFTNFIIFYVICNFWDSILPLAKPSPFTLLFQMIDFDILTVTKVYSLWVGLLFFGRAETILLKWITTQVQWLICVWVELLIYDGIMFLFNNSLLLIYDGVFFFMLVNFFVNRILILDDSKNYEKRDTIISSWFVIWVWPFWIF